MKKTLVALAALAATTAFAQSSVTMSGVADLGAVYRSASTGANGAGNTTGAGKLQLEAGNNNRILFTGVEDLGGGLAATFAFQLRLDPTRGNQERGKDDIGYAATAAVPAVPPAAAVAATPGIGTSRPLFQGESTVGLRSASFGSFKLGRALTAVQLPNGGMIDPWGVTTVGGNVYASGFASDYVQGGEGRVGNAAFYSTPNFAGFSGNLSLGGDKGPTGKKHVALAALYNNGPIAAMIGSEKNRFGDSLLQIGGNYDLGFAKLYAGYGNVKGGAAADRAGSAYLSTASGTQVATDGSIKDYTIGANIPFGAATARIGYSRWNGSGAALQKNENKLGLGVNYALSKRTAIYSDVGITTRNNGVAPNDSKSNAFDLGIAHSF